MNDESAETSRWSIRSLLGPALLGLAVLASLLAVLRNERAAESSSKIVIRFLHWQLEAGYRDAIDEAIRRYEQRNPNVHVIQMAVSDTVYDQFLNINLISGTAPDLAELGKGKFSSDDQYTVRFFLPLGTYIREPNPYNAGTPLEGVPWQDTFLDGMYGGYMWQLQDFYRIAPTIFITRLFYNKEIYQAATGSEEPPKTFGQLMEVGRKVRAWAKAQGRYVVPIVNVPTPNGRYDRETIAPFAVPFMGGIDELADEKLDGEITGTETYASYLRGEWNMRMPQLAAFYGMMRELSDLYEPGFLGMDRQTALFRFANEQALTFFTGSWDAKSIAKQCEGRFHVGVFQFPMPAPGEKYGAYVRGPATEATSAGWSGWGVYKGSAHPEVAIDFLRFLTSQPQNGPIMEIASWPPIVKDSPTSDQMKPFIPNPVGYYSKLEMGLTNPPHGNPDTVYFNELARFLQGEETLEQFATVYEAALRDPESGGDRIWAEEYAYRRQQARTEERLMSIQLLREALDPTATDAPAKFRRSLVVQVKENIGEDYRFRFETLRHKPIPRL